MNITISRIQEFVANDQFVDQLNKKNTLKLVFTNIGETTVFIYWLDDIISKYMTINTMGGEKLLIIHAIKF